MAGGVLFASVGFAALAQARIISPSPEWSQVMPTAPVTGARITEEYAELVGREAYFWGWPLVNVYVRRLVHEKVTETAIVGALPVAPLNHLPEPGCCLRFWRARSRPISGRNPGAGFW
jgi:hypothetical protein